MLSPTRPLLAWYDRERRDLPWRRPDRAGDPYCVWVAEVMLQQTRVAAAIEYYERFLARFPDIATLAAAREADVLAAWSGLGYYRRARQLRCAAQQLIASGQTTLPRDLAGLRGLPGVGRYTAGAIASIAFGTPVAAVDSNVRRVAARWLGAAPPPSQLDALAGAWGCRRPGDFNQALMDLGATVCLPRRPRCFDCPLRRGCRTRGEQPVSRPRLPRRVIIERYALLRRRGRVALVIRPRHAARLPGMWELPPHAGGGDPLLRVAHAITVWKITAEVYAADALAAPRDAQWFTPAEWAKLPVTGLTKKILARLPGGLV